MSLEFPFVEVSDIDLAFPVIPNYREVLEALPDEYDEQSIFMEAAEKWFYGSFNPVADLPNYEVRADSLETATQQANYIKVWSGSFEPKHQDKIAVMGWLLSLAFQKAN